MMSPVSLSSFQRATLKGWDLFDKKKPSDYLDRICLGHDCVDKAEATANELERVFYATKAYALVMVADKKGDQTIENCAPDGSYYGEHLVLLHRIAFNPSQHGSSIDEALKAVYPDGAKGSFRDCLNVYLGPRGRNISPDVVDILLGRDRKRFPNFEVLRFIVGSSKAHLEETLRNYEKLAGGPLVSLNWNGHPVYSDGRALNPADLRLDGA